MASLAVVGLGELGGNLGEDVEIHVVAFLGNLFCLQELEHGTTGFVFVQAVSKFAAHLRCFFKAGEVAGEGNRGDAGEAEIVEAGGVDEFAAAFELMQGGDGGGVAAAPPRLVDRPGLQSEMGEEAVENRAFADSGGANEDAAVTLAEKLLDSREAKAGGGADLENIQRGGEDLPQFLDIFPMVGKIGFVDGKHRGEPGGAGGDDGALDKPWRWLRLAGGDDAQHVEVGADQVAAAAGIKPGELGAPLLPHQLFALDYHPVADHMAGVALDADHLPFFALAKKNLDGNPVVGDDHAVPGVWNSCCLLQLAPLSASPLVRALRFVR